MEELTFSCPVCGADVPRKAKACPDCGACEKSGWSEDHYLDGIDLPDENFPASRALGGEPGRNDQSTSRQRFWWVVTVVLLIAMLWLTLRSTW